MKKEEVEIISRRLASHYEGETCGSCACLGLECYNPSDPRWWYSFLMLFTKEDIQRMTEAHILFRGYPQSR